MRKSTPARRLPARLLSGAFTLVLLLGTLAGVAYLAPSLFGYERYVITGGSMSGTFEKGSIVLDKQVPVADLEVGDVITYLPPPDSGVNTLVTHRIVESDVDGSGATLFRTQGDANPDPDPWTFTLTEGTQPIVEHAVPLLGHVVIALADREVRMLAIGVPAALIALMSLVELAQGIRSEVRTRRSADPVSVPASRRPSHAAGPRPTPAAVVPLPIGSLTSPALLGGSALVLVEPPNAS